jgi:ectoine hydroxylase-related dioxygenase (phytanoyl-CoA dioxygenase family)
MIVRGAVSREAVAELERALDAIIPEVSYAAWAGNMVELPGISRASQRIAQHARDGRIAGWAGEALGAAGVRLLQDTVFVKPPIETARVEWHQDYSYLTYLDPPSVVTARLALTPCTRESGCMRVIDRSHTWGLRGGDLSFRRDRVDDALGELPEELRRHAGASEVWIELEPGDVSLHHCLTFHGSEVNRSGRPRKTLATRLADAACRLVADRLPSPEAAAHFPTDADGHLTGEAFPVVWSR